MTTYAINEQFHGIEISFDSKPTEATRDSLKANGFRWHKVKKVWYARQTADRLELAQSLSELAQTTQPTQAQTTRAWTDEAMNRTAERYTISADGDGWKGANYRSRNIDELKAAIMEAFKKEGIKATARKMRGSMVTGLSFTIKIPEECKLSEAEYIERESGSFPGCRSWIKREDGRDIYRDAFYSLDADEQAETRERTLKAEYEHSVNWGDSAHVRGAFTGLVKAIVESFNYDHSDLMTDYFDSGFYTDYSWK